MTGDKKQLTPEMLVPRLGDALVSAGRISEQDLQNALEYQEQQAAQGRAMLLGQALLELHVIDDASLEQAITEQIIRLRSALQSANRTLERRVHDRTVELQDALERLSELGELKANFVANISHELRTPLTHIKGYLELMVTDSLGPLTDEQRHAMQVSQKSAYRLEKLIEDMLMFSSGAHGEMSFKPDAVDLERLADHALTNVMAEAKERDVDVKVVTAGRIPLVQADEDKILWALDQLLDNAVKFTSAGGRVVVGLKEESPNLVMVTVGDTGVGIPAGRLKEIFEPFHQLDETSARQSGGTGLGLTLVRQIVEAHGSVLGVTSVEGQGSTFRFPLLVAAEAGAKKLGRDK